MIMTIERKQVAPGEFTYMANGNTEICTVKKMGKPLVFECNDFQLELYDFFRNLKWEGDVSTREAARYTIDGNSDYLYDCGRKGKGILKAFNGIYFWRMLYNGVQYEAFEVGVGRKGIYLCIYADDSLIAIVSKKMKSRHFESSYTIYSEDNASVAILDILSIYWDFVRWFQESGSELYVLNTWQKDLKKMYDPNFIAKIKAKTNQKSTVV